MLEPTVKTIDTTIGEITVRAMKRKEQKLVFAAQMKADRTEDSGEKMGILTEAYEKVLQGCVTEMPKKKNLDDLEVGEYEGLMQVIRDLSTAAEKN